MFDYCLRRSRDFEKSFIAVCFNHITEVLLKSNSVYLGACISIFEKLATTLVRRDGSASHSGSGVSVGNLPFQL